MKEAVGLDIGATAVRAARISFDKNPPVLQEFHQSQLVPGAVRDGEIVDPSTVSKAVSDVLGKMRPRRPKAVMLAIANQKILARLIELPRMDEEELRGAISFQVQEFIPIPVEQAILDFQILSQFQADGGEAMMRVLVVAAHQDMIKSYVDVLELAGVNPQSIDFTPLALIRSLSGGPSSTTPADEAEALIQVGAEVTSVVVHEGGLPKLVRVLAAGGEAFTHLKRSEADDDVFGAGAGDRPDSSSMLIEQQAADFVDQIRGSIDYYASQGDGAPIGRLILAGAASKEGDLRSRLSQSLQLPVEWGSPLSMLTVAKGHSSDHLNEDEPAMAASVGVALGAAA